MDLPFTAPLAKGFGPGRSLIIRGVPHHTKARFALTFLDGLELLATQHDDPKGKAVFHVSVRFDERAVVLNSAEDGAWGSEERKPDFPLDHGRNEIQIECTDGSYKVSINGNYFGEFLHRFDKDVVTHLNFYGDFKIQELIYN